MSLETDALDAAALAATNQTVAANNLKNAIDLLTTSYAATKDTVDNDLNNVENIADADKVISDAVLNALALYTLTGDLATINSQPINTGLDLLIARGAVEVPFLEYENRASLRAPVLPVPLTGDVVIIPHLGEFQYFTIAEYLETYVDDDETVFEAIHPTTGLVIGQWVMSTPAYEWTEAQKLFENAVLWEWMEDEQLRFNTY
jgi:hypothetical protein